MQAAVEVDIIVYEPPGRASVCVEAFTPRGKEWLQNCPMYVQDKRITIREALETSGLRYEVVAGKPS